MNQTHQPINNWNITVQLKSLAAGIAQSRGRQLHNHHNLLLEFRNWQFLARLDVDGSVPCRFHGQRQFGGFGDSRCIECVQLFCNQFDRCQIPRFEILHTQLPRKLSSYQIRTNFIEIQVHLILEEDNQRFIVESRCQFFEKLCRIDWIQRIDDCIAGNDKKFNWKLRISRWLLWNTDVSTFHM